MKLPPWPFTRTVTTKEHEANLQRITELEKECETLRDRIRELEKEQESAEQKPPAEESSFDEKVQTIRNFVRDRIDAELREARLEKPPRRDWRAELAFLDDDLKVTPKRVEERFRYLSKSRHPDNFGTSTSYRNLVRAKDEALRELE